MDGWGGWLRWMAGVDAWGTWMTRVDDWVDDWGG